MPSAMTSNGAGNSPNLEAAVVDLEAVAQVPKKKRATDINGVVESIRANAFDHGVAPAVLERLINILISPNHLDQASHKTLIGSLYPSGPVSQAIVTDLLGCFGQGDEKPHPTVQVGLLRWLVLIYDVLDGEARKTLERGYGVLFNLLDMLSLRLELARSTNNEPGLIGLTRVYKDYYPDVVVAATAGRGSSFVHPDLEWHHHLLAIQQANAEADQEGLNVQSSFRVLRRGAKRSKVSAVPDLRTSHATESSITLEEIDSVPTFIDQLDAIELPNQIASVIRDPLLQKYLALRPSEVARRRLDDWLEAFFADQLAVFRDTGKGSRALGPVLEDLASYTQATKVLLPVVQEFLQNVLALWDGRSDRDALLGLLAFVPLDTSSEERSSLLTTLEGALLDNTPSSRRILVSFYTSILRHWTVTILSRPASSSNDSRSPNPHQEALQNLISRVSTLCLALLESECPPSFSSESTVLTFYETFSSALSHASHADTLRIITPPAQLIYLLTFSPSLSSLSRLCGILAHYKRAFEHAISTPSTRPPPDDANPDDLFEHTTYPRTTVNSFNGFLMDICNLLWRNRGFNTEDVNALGCGLPRATVLPALRLHADRAAVPLPTLFSLSHHPVLCHLSITAFRRLEDAVATDRAGDLRTRHAGPVTQRSLLRNAEEGGIECSWADYRLEVLRYLESRGVGGIGELMGCTMKVLMRAGTGGMGGK
ncbi:MAG: hypothetical protein M1817_006629 [Caeruleum heppii]|nr:MAG: hypothetical protein M1817_006629 [Caeruleum heppii]